MKEQKKMGIEEAVEIVKEYRDGGIIVRPNFEIALNKLIAFAEEAPKEIAKLQSRIKELEKPSVGLQEMRFNIPKDAEDKRRLLIDLENKIGVPLREDRGFFVIAPYFSVGVEEIVSFIVNHHIVTFDWDSVTLAQALLNEFVITRREK